MSAEEARLRLCFHRPHKIEGPIRGCCRGLRAHQSSSVRHPHFPQVLHLVGL